MMGEYDKEAGPSSYGSGPAVLYTPPPPEPPKPTIVETVQKFLGDIGKPAPMDAVLALPAPVVPVGEPVLVHHDEPQLDTPAFEDTVAIGEAASTLQVEVAPQPIAALLSEPVLEAKPVATTDRIMPRLRTLKSWEVAHRAMVSLQFSWFQFSVGVNATQPGCVFVGLGPFTVAVLIYGK